MGRLRLSSGPSIFASGPLQQPSPPALTDSIDTTRKQRKRHRGDSRTLLHDGKHDVTHKRHINRNLNLQRHIARLLLPSAVSTCIGLSRRPTWSFWAAQKLATLESAPRGKGRWGGTYQKG